MKELDVKKLTTAGVIAALIFVLTLIHIPNIAGGYIHLGDSLVFFAALIVGPIYGFLAAGVGAMLSDLLSGYPQYAIPTFVIKGIMTLIVYFGYSFMKTRLANSESRISKFGKFGAFFTIALVASVFMGLGYFLVEIPMYGLGGALANIPGNILQGGGCTIVGTILLLPIETIILHSVSSK